MRPKHFVAGTFMVFGFAGPALAADLPSIKGLDAPAPIARVYSWTGPYAGIQLGYTWGNDVTKEYLTANRLFVGLQNYFKPRGFSSGVHVGYNYQFANLVIGAEADIEAADIRGGFTDPPAAPFNPGGHGLTKINIQGSLRARAGYAMDRTLIYVTGGLAVAQMTSTYKNWALTSESFTRTVSGLTIGAGVEHAVTDFLTLRGEYRYTAYPLFWNNSLVAFPGFSGTQHPRNHSFRVGASYRF